MEINKESKDQGNENKWFNQRHSHAGKVFAGVLVVGAGVLLLAKQFGADIPCW